MPKGRTEIMRFKESPFCKHHNNLFREDSSMDGKTRLKVCVVTDIYIISDYLPTKYLSVTKGKVVPL